MKKKLNKKFKILPSLPAYGPMYIPVAPNNQKYYSEGFVVQFFPTNSDEWVANFKPGWTELCEIIELAKSNSILVLANGQGYLMDIEVRKVVECFGVNFETIFSGPHSQIILQDCTDITVVEPNGEIWRSDRISYDGIKDIEVEGSKVKGLAFDIMDSINEWKSFELNLIDRTLAGGSYQQYNL